VKSWPSISLLLNIIGLLGIAFVVWWMGGISNLWSRIQNRGLTKEYHMLKDQYAQLPQDSVDVLLLGNSLTYYGEWSDWIPQYRIANRGIPGDGIEGLRARMGDYTAVKPILVIVMIGINDLSFHPKEWLIERYPGFIKALTVEYNSAKVVIQSILPVNNTVSNTGLDNSDIRWVNDRLKELLRESPVEFQDITATFVDQREALRADWTADGLHLTGAAYKNWANLLQVWMADTMSENR